MGAVKRGIRNTFRNKMRTVGIIVILAVAIALSISMVIGRSAVDNRISQVQGHTADTLTITSAQGFQGFGGAGSSFPASDISKVTALAHVSSVASTYSSSLTPGTNTNLASPISSTGGFGGGGFGSQFASRINVVGTNSPGTGVANNSFGGGTETLTAGKAYATNSTSDVAIVGSNLASKDALAVGSTFTAWSATVSVVGIYSAGTNNFANNDVLMPLATVQKLSGHVGDVSTAIVTVDNSANLTSVQTAIESALGSTASVQSANSATQASLDTLDSTKSTTTYILWGTIGAAAIILLLSMLMIVRERRREIGVLKAIGAPNRSVVAQFVVETSTFTVISAVVGFGLGILLANPLTNQIYSPSSPGTGPGGFASRFNRGGSGGPGLGGIGRSGISHAFNTLSTSVGWSTLLFAFLIAIGVAIIGSAVASANILRIRPAEVLRSE